MDLLRFNSMVMKATFILITFLILEQVNGKKRVVIHVPNKINNIHHHHVKKVVVYKPVPVKCHHDDKHDWHEGWESTQKDEWVDKRPSAQVPIPVKHPAWPSPEVIKGGYVSGERISSDSWDAAGAAASVKQLKTPQSQIETHDEEDELPYHPYSSKKRPATVNPSGWKVWPPSDVTENRPVNPSKYPAVGSGIRLQNSIVHTPKEQYVTYKVVKKKITKQRIKKNPINVSVSTEPLRDGYRNYAQPASWSEPQEIKLRKSRPKTPYNHDQRVKISHYNLPEDSQSQITYDQDLYVSSSSIKPQMYPKVHQTSNLSPKLNSRLNPLVQGHSNVQSQPIQSQNTYYMPESSLRPYYESEAYFTSRKPSLSAQELQNLPGHPKTYYDQDADSGPSGHAIRTDQESYTFNAQNIKALLDQNVPTVVGTHKRKPAYNLDVHNSNKLRPNSSSYQMRYSHLSNTTPMAFLINHRNINLNHSD